MHTTYDESADAAYIYLTDRIGRGESVLQIEVQDDELPGTIVLDLNEDHELIGVEILGASTMLPTGTLGSFVS